MLTEIQIKRKKKVPLIFDELVNEKTATMKSQKKTLVFIELQRVLHHRIPTFVYIFFLDVYLTDCQWLNILFSSKMQHAGVNLMSNDQYILLYVLLKIRLFISIVVC